MIACAECVHCATWNQKDGTYNIGCRKNGGFQVGRFHAERFSCNDFTAKEEPPETPRDNVMVVLKSGRDFILHDENLEKCESREEWIKACKAGSCFNGVLIGGIDFNDEEIAAVSILK